MYNQHFGLEKAPFKITPDTGMFFTGAGRGEVLEALVYAVVSGEGIIKVVGEVGTGKTMLCRMLELKLPANVDIVYLANPSLSPEDILHAIALEMSLAVGNGVNRIQVLHQIQQHLVAMHARNRHVVVLVEEAQSMPNSTLEEIRLLSNLETKQDKLLQIVLFGQPELDDKLSDPGIRQLRDRITHSFYLDPLDPDEIREYVDFRLRGAGFRGRDAFRKGAYEVMARASEGLTRRVNILADKALLAAFAEDTHDVTRKHARIAANDSQFGRRRRWGWPELAVGVGLVTITAAIGWAILGDWGGKPAAVEPLADAGAARSGVFVSDVQADAGAPLPAVPVAEAAPQQASAAPVAGSAAPDPAIPTVPAPVVVAALAPPARVQAPVPVAVAAPTPPARVQAPVPVAVAAPTPPAQAQAPALAVGSLSAPAPRPTVRAPSAPPAAVPMPEPAAAAPTPAPPTAPASPVGVAALVPEAVAAPPAPSRSASPEPGGPTAAGAALDADSAPPPRAEPVPAGSLLDARLDATRDWLARADRTHYSIQLLVTDVSRRSNLEAFLRERARANELEALYVYRTDINGESRYGVLYREYSSFAEARDALERLPPELARHRPFIRNVRDIAALG